LKLVRRKEISEKIKVALAFGDISENSEYDEAKNEQANVESRIAKLELMIKNAKIINEQVVNDYSLYFDIESQNVVLSSNEVINDVVFRYMII